LFFLTIVIVLSSAPDDHIRQHQQFQSFRECDAARQAYMQQNPPTASGKILSAVCASGRPPPPTPLQAERDRELVDKTKRAIELLKAR
jgi:hypothetical protein